MSVKLPPPGYLEIRHSTKEVGVLVANSPATAPNPNGWPVFRTRDVLPLAEASEAGRQAGLAVLEVFRSDVQSVEVTSCGEPRDV